MAITKKGWNRSLMMSLFTKEATYDAGVTMSNANACGMKQFDGGGEWVDKVQNDKDVITGQEFGTDQELITAGYKLVYKEPRAKPNTLAGLAALAFGNVVSTDAHGNLTAYIHRIEPCIAGSTLPSIQVEEKVYDFHYKYTGVKCNTLKISGAAGESISVEAELLGSGTRTASTANIAGTISESWMKVGNCKVWMEDGTDISIDATLNQNAEDISSGTPDNVGARLKSFEFTWDNALEGQFGFGSGSSGIFADIDYGRRKAGLKISMLFNSTAELTLFLNQTPVAIEFDLKGSLITGTTYYGCHLIIPRFKITSAPIPKGGVNDTFSIDMDCDVQADGTNPVAIIEVYNGKAAYLA